MASGTLVIGEATEDGKLNPVVPELIGIGRRLGGPVTVALLGSGVEGLAQEAAAFGASKVIVVDDAILKEYQGDSYVRIAGRIAKEVDTAVIVMGQTMMGRDMPLRLAQRLGTAVAMDCVNFEMQGDKLVAERPCYGGSARARYTINGMPQMATVRAKSQEPLAPDASRTGEIVKQDAGSPNVRTKITDRRKEKAEGVRLEDAKVVVSGG